MRAHAASDPADTITDFQFSPGTITIHVGDTVTWTNSGPSSHSATASNGSFDTGILKKGQSGSHTFTQAGTYAYICSIHPFMHGTVVVVANTTTTPSPTGSAASTSGTSTSPTSTSSTNSLPRTGVDLLAMLVTAVTLLAAGFGLRTANARRRRRA